MTRQFGEEGRRLSYGSYLRLLELLQLQTGLSEEHDELLFMVAPQASELWFKVGLHERVGARSRMDADDIFYARHLLRRVCVIEKLLVEQIEVLETMSPQDFLAFRSQLAPASGFQSVQFREIEFLSGVKEPEYLARVEATPDEMNRLRKRLEEPSLADVFRALVKRRGSPSLRDIYIDRERHADLFDLCEALLDHDETFALWRARHVLMVERQIGSKPGHSGRRRPGYPQSTPRDPRLPQPFDGSTLALVSPKDGPAGVCEVAVTGGEPRTAFAIKGAAAHGLSWSRTGDLYVSAHRGGTEQWQVYVRRPDGRLEDFAVSEGDRVQHHLSHYAASPDGSTVAIGTNARVPEDVDVAIVDAKTGRQRLVASGPAWPVAGGWRPRRQTGVGSFGASTRPGTPA